MIFSKEVVFVSIPVQESICFFHLPDLEQSKATTRLLHYSGEGKGYSFEFQLGNSWLLSVDVFFCFDW